MRGKGTGITTPTENEGIECKKKNRTSWEYPIKK